jgi:sterol 3beta-glucosyltransferase
MFQGGFMITILCSGSRGDYQPYLALAQALKNSSQAIRIVGGESFRELINDYGFEFYPLSIDYLSADIDPALIQAAQSSDNPLKMLLTFNKMKNYVTGLTTEMYQACIGSDLIIYHPGCAIGYFAGRDLGIPSILAAPFPMHRTKSIASLITYGRKYLPTSLSYTLLQNMLWMAGKTGIKAFYQTTHGTLPTDFNPPFETVDQQHPAIISCSNYVFPRPNDWNAHIHQEGYWFLEEPQPYIPDQDLQAFITNGQKPIYIGFGSVFDARDQAATIQIIIDALAITNQRAIISGMGKTEQLPSNIFAVNNIPHSWLFEQVSLVVHHGGAGTTAAGFKAGVPSIIIPFSNDQFAWAHRAYDLGVAPTVFYRKQLNAKKLAKAINEALSEQIINNAQQLAAKIALENGAATCAQVIIQCLKTNN